MATETAGVPLVSVIVPAFNRQTSIEAAVRSVLEQADVALECIVVDDGSTDDTPSRVAALTRTDPRVVSIVSPVNEGASSARNRALAVARGEWIAFLDADDVLRSGALAAMLAAAAATDARAVVGQRISSDGTRTWFPPSYDIPDIRQAGVKSIAGQPGLLYYVGPAGKLFHRDIVSGLRFEGRMLGDQPWIVEALLRAGNRIAVIEDIVYEWRRPSQDHDFSTITAARVGSARLAAEATRIAGETYRLVAAKFDAYVAAEHRRDLRVTYAERLIRADLESQLRSALERRDPELPELFRELERFLETIEGDVVRSVGAVELSLLAPAAGRLDRIGPASREAFWSLLRTAASLHVGADAPVRSRRRAAIRVLMVVPAPLQRPFAEPPLRVLSRRVERARRVRSAPHRDGGQTRR